MNIETRVLSSMEKVFANQAPAPLSVPMTCLQGENYAFQVALRPDAPFVFKAGMNVYIHSELPITIKKVGYVPAEMLFVTNKDGRYLTSDPGLFPDPLYDPEKPLKTSVKSSEQSTTPGSVASQDVLSGTPGTADEDYAGIFTVVTNRWNSFMLETRPEDIKPGVYPVDITFSINHTFEHGVTSVSHVHCEIEVMKASLPAQDVKYTCWFHGDCLADYYHVPVFSEEHWKAMRAFIETAARYGQNMLLTPIFTPPLDTGIGLERTTIQLIDVTVENGVYSFNFDKLTRFINMALECGIRYIEISHLFTQWGGKCCPKVMATVDGEYKKIFGWDQEALSDEYKAFLSTLLPQLIRYLDEAGLRGKTYFHLTDEPNADHLPQYLALKEFVAPIIAPYPIMDAMSEYRYFEEGVSEIPVVATSALAPFLAGKRPDEFWVYYCVGQGHSNLSNRYLAMPGYRTRILGVQLYKENVAGFLQWGYNFYNSSQSRKHINPYQTTDADNSFPAGDSFIVYPGEDETCVTSQRLIIFGEALQDVRALKLLESLTSREHVLALIQEDAQDPITFTEYPTGENYLLKLREKVNREIQQLV